MGTGPSKSLSQDTTMEIDCHNRSLTDTLKSKKGNLCLVSGLIEESTIPFRSRDDRFYRYIRVNFKYGLLDCNWGYCHTLYR